MLLSPVCSLSVCSGAVGCGQGLAWPCTPAPWGPAAAAVPAWLRPSWRALLKCPVVGRPLQDSPPLPGHPFAFPPPCPQHSSPECADPVSPPASRLYKDAALPSHCSNPQSWTAGAGPILGEGGSEGDTHSCITGSSEARAEVKVSGQDGGEEPPPLRVPRGVGPGVCSAHARLPEPGVFPRSGSPPLAPLRSPPYARPPGGSLAQSTLVPSASPGPACLQGWALGPPRSFIRFTAVHSDTRCLGGCSMQSGHITPAQK